MRAPVSREVAANAITITAMNVRPVSNGIPSAATKRPPPLTNASSLGPRPEAADQLP